MTTCKQCKHNFEVTWTQQKEWVFCPSCSSAVKHPEFTACGSSSFFHSCSRMKGHDGKHSDSNGSWSCRHEDVAITCDGATHWEQCDTCKEVVRTEACDENGSWPTDS